MQVNLYQTPENEWGWRISTDEGQILARCPQQFDDEQACLNDVREMLAYVANEVQSIPAPVEAPPIVGIPLESKGETKIGNMSHTHTPGPAGRCVDCGEVLVGE